MICKYGKAYKIKIKVGSLSHNCDRIREIDIFVFSFYFLGCMRNLKLIDLIFGVVEYCHIKPFAECLNYPSQGHTCHLCTEMRFEDRTILKSHLEGIWVGKLQKNWKKHMLE